MTASLDSPLWMPMFNDVLQMIIHDLAIGILKEGTEGR